MVTSSAVVGSSAIRSFGRQASAIAIITRWRSPPESSCGYCPSRRSGAPIPTSRNRSSTCARVSARVAGRCRRSASPIWKPTGKVGLSEVIGSWKIIPIRLPRTRAHGALVERQQILAFEQDPAALDPRRRHRQQPHHRPRGDALAAARFAHQADDPASLDDQRQIVDDGGVMPLGPEADDQSLDLEQHQPSGARAAPPQPGSPPRRAGTPHHAWPRRYA